MKHKFRHVVNNILINLTQPRPTRAVYAIISILSFGILILLFSALGAHVPSPSHANLGPDVAGMADGRSSSFYSGKASVSSVSNTHSHRMAIIIPYLPPSDGASPTFPSYFDLFAMSAAGSASHIDFLIFHCFIPPQLLPDVSTLPSNVKLIDLNSDISSEQNNQCGLAKLFTRVTDQRQEQQLMETPLDQLIPTLSSQIMDFPYILVEYKPAFGHIFADYLTDYSHWGYSDIDVVFGDMTRWIDTDEWNEYDIVTYGFGDQDKLYLRGQFTFHKNDPKVVNQLWRHCKYLSEMDIRYSKRYESVRKFESAEGCYSQAVIRRKDIKVKWAVKAFSDVGEGSPVYTQGMYLSLGSAPSWTSSRSYVPKSVLYTAADVHSGKRLLDLSTNWFEDKTKYVLYNQQDESLQQYEGAKSKVETYRSLYESGDEEAKDVKCMYWAPKDYQMDICTVEGTVSSDDVVTLENGVLYKQKFRLRNDAFPPGINSFPFFHFQEWKRVYRSTQLLMSKHARSAASPGLIVTKEGSLPLFNTESTSWRKRNKLGKPKIVSNDWMVSDTGSTSSRQSSNKFCLKSSLKGYPKGATVCNVSASWMGARASDSSSQSTLVEGLAAVNIIRSPATTSKLRGKKKGDATIPSWWDEKLFDAVNGVTLSLTLQITSADMKDESVVKNLLSLADSNIYTWGTHQPSLLLIYLDASAEDGELLARTRELVNETFGTMDSETPQTAHLKGSLVTIVESEEPSVSRKALMNMAAHAAPTRWIVTGLELERGLVLSKETALYATREALVHTNMPGHAFVIPQFASTRDDTRANAKKEENVFLTERHLFSSVGADLLPMIREKQTMSSNLEDFDCMKCSGKKPVALKEKDDDEPGVGGGETFGDDEVEETSPDEEEEGEDQQRRRLTELSSFEKSAEQQLEDLWWNLSVVQVYGTAGGFNSKVKTSLSTVSKAEDHIEVALLSLLDRSNDHEQYLRHFDKSPILMIDRNGPRKGMMTLDLAAEVEEFRGKRCYNLLRLAQLAALGYNINVLQGVFAASYPKTRTAVCKKEKTQRCDCELESEATIKQLLIDEVKRPGKIAVLMNEFESKVNQ